MGKYDIGSEKINGWRYTINDLSNELQGELNLAQGQDEIRLKFKNVQKSGLIDKLKDELNFRIEEFENTFQSLQLLKYLYLIEKAGESKVKANGADKSRIRIIDILAKPRLDNIQNLISPKSVYGTLLSKIETDIGRALPTIEMEDRKKRIESFLGYWNAMLIAAFDYVYTEKALRQPESAKDELVRIERFVNDRILAKLPKIKTLQIPYSEQPFQVFYNCIICHRVLCLQIDNVNINYQICIDGEPPKEYIDLFIKHENHTVQKQFLKLLATGQYEIQNLEAHFKKLVFGKLEITESDFKQFKSASKYVLILLQWLKEFKKAEYSEGIPLPFYLVAIQEIMFVKRTGEKFKNDYYGNTYQIKAMFAALKNPEKADAVIKLAWITKLENRYAINLGSYEQLQIKRRIENSIYQIQTRLFEYQNLTDIELASFSIGHFLARSMVSREVTVQLSNKFSEIIYRLCGYRSVVVNNNVYDFFREMMHSESISGTDKELKIASEKIASKIIAYENEDSEKSYISKVAKFSEYKFESTNYNQHCQYILIFTMYYEKKQIELINFYEVVPDELAKRLCKLGLEKFVKH